MLSEGRISLKVMTEVSDMSQQQLADDADSGHDQTVDGAVDPHPPRRHHGGNSVRRFAGDGRHDPGRDQAHQVNGLPGLMELPILGPLFKSNDYINQQTELMVLVTPYVVRAVAQKDLSRPDDGFADPSDPAQVLLGRFNRIYGVGGIADPPDNYRGKYGFILD